MSAAKPTPNNVGGGVDGAAADATRTVTIAGLAKEEGSTLVVGEVENATSQFRLSQFLLQMNTQGQRQVPPVPVLAPGHQVVACYEGRYKALVQYDESTWSQHLSEQLTVGNETWTVWVLARKSSDNSGGSGDVEVWKSKAEAAESKAEAAQLRNQLLQLKLQQKTQHDERSAGLSGTPTARCDRYFPPDEQGAEQAPWWDTPPGYTVPLANVRVNPGTTDSFDAIGGKPAHAWTPGMTCSEAAVQSSFPIAWRHVLAQASKNDNYLLDTSTNPWLPQRTSTRSDTDLKPDYAVVPTRAPVKPDVYKVKSVLEFKAGRAYKKAKSAAASGGGSKNQQELGSFSKANQGEVLEYMECILHFHQRWRAIMSAGLFDGTFFQAFLLQRTHDPKRFNAKRTAVYDVRTSNGALVFATFLLNGVNVGYQLPCNEVLGEYVNNGATSVVFAHRNAAIDAAAKVFIKPGFTAAHERSLLATLDNAMLHLAAQDEAHEHILWVAPRLSPLPSDFRNVRALFGLVQEGGQLRRLHTEYHCVHCDIRPANVMEKDGKIWLVDYGAHRKLNASAPYIHGTVRFASDRLAAIFGMEEQEVVVTPVDDLISFGRTVLTFLYNRHPPFTQEALVLQDYWAGLEQMPIGPALMQACRDGDYDAITAVIN